MDSRIGSAVSFLRKNPLCGINLKLGAYCVAGGQMMVAFVRIIMHITVVDFLHTSKDDIAPQFTTRMNRLILLILLRSVFFQLFWFLLYAFLIKGTRASKVTTVERVWILMVVGTLADVILAGLDIILTEESARLELVAILSLVLDIFSVWVVSAFRRELKRGADMGQIRKMGAETDSTGGDFERIV